MPFLNQSNGSVRSFSLDEASADVIDALAEDMRVSRSQLIREAIGYLSLVYSLAGGESTPSQREEVLNTLLLEMVRQ